MRTSLFTGLAVLALLAACDTGSVPGFVGISCTTASDCNSGLDCLEYEVPAGDGGCKSLGMQCAQSCKTNADCTSSGPGWACYAACGTITLCQPAMDAAGQ